MYIHRILFPTLSNTMIKIVQDARSWNTKKQVNDKLKLHTCTIADMIMQSILDVFTRQ